MVRHCCLRAACLGLCVATPGEGRLPGAPTEFASGQWFQCAREPCRAPCLYVGLVAPLPCCLPWPAVLLARPGAGFLGSAASLTCARGCCPTASPARRPQEVTKRSSSSARRRSGEYIAPGFSTAADLETELVAPEVPARRSLLGQVLAMAMIAADAVLSIPFGLALRVFETFYQGVQACLLPLARAVPRSVLGIDVFTANTVTFGRVFLVIPVAIALSHGQEPLLPEGVTVSLLPAGLDRLPGVAVAAVLILWHDFLDHLDGIVALAQRQTGAAAGDDPLFGGFIDAFIDKVFFAITVWSTLLCCHFPSLSAALADLLRGTCGSVAAAAGAPPSGSSLALECCVLLACAMLIAYEVAIATVRVNDFFTEKLAPPPEGERRRKMRAAMEGKLKQKLTSIGLAFLALATPHLESGFLVGRAGWTAVVLLVLATYMAHKSLTLKLAAYPGWEGFLPMGSSQPM